MPYAFTGSAEDSPFYIIDRFAEKLQLKLTREEVARARLRLKFSEERLAEAHKLAMANKLEFAKSTISDYENELQEAELDLEAAKDLGKNVEEIRQHISEMTAKHTEVLQKVLTQVPDTARPAIMKAIEISQKNRLIAMQNIEQAAKEEIVEEVVEEELEIEEEHPGIEYKEMHKGRH